MRRIYSSRAGFPRDGLHDLLFDGVKVERSGFLNRRELYEGLAELSHLLLDEDEAPEFVFEPLSLLQGLPHASSLQRVQAEVRQDRPVDLDCAAKPALRLINEAVFVVADAHRAERRLGEVENFVALRRPLAGDEVELVVAVEVNFVSFVAELLALLQILDDVRVAGGGHEGREPVETGHQAVLDFARGNLARPTKDAWHAESAFEHGSFAASERSLPSVGPGEVLG